MTSMRVAEVQHQLRRRAYARKEEFGAVLSWFVGEGLALRLALHREIRSELLLSGDLMLHACLGGEAPFEWHAELLAAEPVSPARLAQRLREVCNVEVDDGLDLELPAGGISDPVSMAGGRCSMATLVGHLGSIKVPLQVVIRFDEPISQKPGNYRLDSVLGAQLNAWVLTCPPAALAALRLREACGFGAAPTGMKVLWDLYRLIDSGKVEPELASVAVTGAFPAGGAAASMSVPLLLSEGFAAEASRQRVWSAFLKRARLTGPDLGEVVRRVQQEAWPWLTSGLSGQMN